MRLVGDDGEPLALRRRQFAHRLQRKGKGLDGADDDLLARRQRLGELAALAAPSLLMVATTPCVRSKSESASCNCPSITLRSETTITVEKSFWSLASCRSARKCAVQAIELVLPDPAECWMRYLPPAPSSQHRRAQLPRGVELVIAGEDELRDLLLLVFLGHDIAAEDFQPAVARPDLFPEVARRMPVRVRRVAGRAVVALVERQEKRLRPVEPRRHVDFGVADREMHQRPAREAQQRLGALALRLRVAVEAVLVDRRPRRSG